MKIALQEPLGELPSGSNGDFRQVLLETHSMPGGKLVNYGELIPVYPAVRRFYPQVQIVEVAAEQRIAV